MGRAVTAFIELHTGTSSKPRRVIVNVFNVLTITESTDGQVYLDRSPDPEDRVWVHETYDEIKRLINLAGYGVAREVPWRPIGPEEGSRAHG